MLKYRYMKVEVADMDALTHQMNFRGAQGWAMKGGVLKEIGFRPSGKFPNGVKYTVQMERVINNEKDEQTKKEKENE